MGTQTRLRLPQSKFLDAVRKSGLLTPDDLIGLFADKHLDEATLADPIQVATVLIRKKLLTKFQAMQLLNGKTQGFRLDHYTIIDGVRQDRVGIVFLAEDSRTRRTVWVKVLPTDRVSDNTILQAFTKEVRLAAKVDHANVARVLDMGMARGTHYVVTESAAGPTLDKVLAAKGPLPPNLAAQYVAQAAVGLKFAHEQGLYHRDVKPANVAVGADGRAKLLDLGLTHMLENPWARVTRRISTKEYAEEIDHVAPEQAWGWEPDARSDIYSLGSTFYSLVTGQSPFPGSAAEKMQERQLRGVPAPSKVRPGLGRDLDAVVVKMGAKDPHERYQSAAEVVAALHPYLPLAQWLALGVGAAEEPRPRKPVRGKVADPSAKTSGGTGVWAALTGITTALFKRPK